MRFAKYQALGNDYLVVEPGVLTRPLTPAQIRQICDRHYGAGSDGILVGPLDSLLDPDAISTLPTLPDTLVVGGAGFSLRIFNPDGSEAEKSGNGLRIFARYHGDAGLVGDAEFAIETPGGLVRATLLEAGRQVRVEMGQVRFWSDEIPVAGPRREVLNERLTVQDRTFTFCAATIGNPHCVVPLPAVSADLARTYGPGIERHELFPRRTNVQFLQVLDRGRLRLEIWERGAGYTLASGSSSSAAAAVAHRLGLCDRHLRVEMPGGELAIEIGPDYAIRMTGPVTRVAAGNVDPGLWSEPLPAGG
jgi:diaminopimelate epimerase